MPVFQFWPSHWGMSWQFIRLVSEAHYGGGDFHELHGAARDIPAGDTEAWHREFYQLGERVAQLYQPRQPRARGAAQRRNPLHGADRSSLQNMRRPLGSRL